MQFRNRVTEMLGVDLPVVQAPMGWIARSQLASAVSNAGGMGIIETSSGELDKVKEEILKIHGSIDLINQKIDTIENNHLKHIQKSIDRIQWIITAIGLGVLGQVLVLVTKHL